MKLIHKHSQKTAVIGDLVTDFKGKEGHIAHFKPPHKPASSGHVTVTITSAKPLQLQTYNYVGTWGLIWVDREDRK